MIGIEQLFNNVLLVSDVDGTLASDFKNYPQRNVDAVKRFHAKGGRFTIATGRHFQAVKEIVRLFEIHAPLILLNGGCIYDADAQKPIATHYLPQSAFDYMHELCHNPHLSSIRVMAADEKAYVVYAREDEDINSFEYKKYQMEFKSLEELCGMDLCKVLLVTNEQESAAFRAFVSQKNYTDVEFVASSERYYEMIPKGIHKAQGIGVVAQILNIDMSRVVAIGDYDNDLEMIEAVGFGVAPANAVDSVKAVARLVVGHCKDGAVADLIEYLETNLPANKN